MQRLNGIGTASGLFLFFGCVLGISAQSVTKGGLIFTEIQPNLPTAPSYVTTMKAYPGGAVILFGDVAGGVVANQIHTFYDMDAVTGHVTKVVGDGDKSINGDFLFDWYPTATGISFNTMTVAIQNMANGPNYSANWWYDKASGNITQYYGPNSIQGIKTLTGVVTGKPWYSSIVRVCPTPSGNVHCALVGMVDANNPKPDPTKFTFLGMVNIDTTPWQSITQLTNLQVGNVNGGLVYFPFQFAIASDGTGFNFAETDPFVTGAPQRYNKIVYSTWSGKQTVPFGDGMTLNGETILTWSDVTMVPLDSASGSYVISYATANGRRVAAINGGQATVIEKSQDFTAQPNSMVTVPSYGSPYFLGKSVYLGNAVMSIAGNGQMLLFGNGDKMPDGTSAAIMDGFSTPDGAIIYGRDGGGVYFWWWKVVVASTIPTPAPTVQLTTSATDIILGQTATLSWTATNADTAMLTPGFGSVASTTGSQGVSPASTTTYTLTATGAGGVASANVTVTVHIEPYITAMTDLMGHAKASYAQTEFVTLYGNKLCSQTATANAPFGDRFGNCQIQLSDGSLAVLQYTSPAQINLMLLNAKPGTYTLKVIDWTAGTSTQGFPVTITTVSPTLVTNSSGSAAIFDNTTGAIVYGGPARPADVITYFLTGLGLADANLPFGAAGVENVIALVKAYLNDQVITVLAAVSSPDFPGLYQVSVQLPATGGNSNSSLSIQVGNAMVTSAISIQ